MSDDALIRLENLRALGLSPGELSMRVGGRYTYWRDMLAGNKAFGEKIARKIEEKLDRPRGSMDVPIVQTARPVANVTPAPVGTRRIPLIDYVQAGEMTAVADPHVMGDAADWLLTDLGLSNGAFALEIKGDSMLPDFKPGDRVIIDPAVQPQPGDYVVAKNGEDEATFKKYRLRGMNERGDMVFELVPLNADYDVIRSDLVPTRIVGTMVEHRRYRRR